MQQIQNERLDQDQPKIYVENSMDGSKYTESYECTCGKKYHYFTSIYIHFRKKHHIKLSTHHSEKRRKVVIEGKNFKYIYSHAKKQRIFHQIERNNSQQQILKKKKKDLELKNVSLTKNSAFDLLVEQFGKKEEFPQVLNYLRIYISELEQQNQKTISVNELPQFFNSFMTSYIPEKVENTASGTEKWSQLCYQLFEFAEWMMENGKTSLKVLINTL